MAKMKTTFESFISITSFGDKYPVTEFSDGFFKRNPELKEIFEKHIPTGEISIISGKGFNVCWSEKHNCDCEYCGREEEKDSFFQTEAEARK